MVPGAFDVIEISLPFPPSTNSLWRRSGQRIHKSSRYTEWLRTAGFAALAQKPGAISGPYRLSVFAVRPDKRRRDIDNLLKATGDLLVSIGVIADDCLCQKVSAEWVDAALVDSGEGVVVQIEAA